MGRRDHLRGLLARVRPADSIEAEHLARFQELLTSDGDPFCRSHFEPGHVTASAFVLAPRGDDLLLIAHRKLHRWLQPGGHVDPGDHDVVAAARREVAEEVGLSDLTLVQPGVFDLDVHDIPPLKGEPAHAHFDVRFLFRAPTRTVQAGSDADAARWTPLAEVDARGSDESVMRAVRKIASGGW